MRRIAAGILVTMLAIGPALTAAAQPSRAEYPGRWRLIRPPAVTAPSWILYDLEAGREIASLDADAQRSPASTTKIMTALVALERAAPDDLVTVRSGAPEVGEAEIGLVAGESFPMALLLEAMLVRSANDAAVAVAEHIAGSVPAFVDLMNEKALELGLANTHFENPHGLDGEAHYTSARDLLTITLAAFQHRGFSDLVSSTEVIFPAAPDGTLREAQTTNHLLLDYRGAIGVKTGFTNRAGLVLVAAAERGGRTLLAVVMGSEGEGRHFTDAAALLDYGFVAAARLGVLMGGRYPATRDGSPSRLQREGILETLIYLHGAQLETAPLLQAAPSVVETVRTGPDPLPDLQASLGWINRYWRLWSGG